MLVETQRRSSTSVVDSPSIAIHLEVRKKTVESIRRAERRENPFRNLSTGRKKMLLIALLAKPLVEPSEV